jgi:hypothetical protein
MVAVIPETVPVKVGEARGAFAARRAESFTQFDPFHFKISPEVAEVIVTSPTSSRIDTVGIAPHSKPVAVAELAFKK